jgi:hypothetical protein
VATPFRSLLLVSLVPIVSCSSFSYGVGPGAVRVTQNARDVQGCESLGTVESVWDQRTGFDPIAAQADIQDQTESLGGNIALVIQEDVGTMAGVAYSCSR